MTKKKSILQICLLLCVLILVYYLFRNFFIGRTVTYFYPNDPDKITKLEVMSGNTGNTITITSKEDMKAITDYLSTLNFRNALPSQSSGWDYSITAYYDDMELITLVNQGDHYTVNGTSYNVTSSKGISLNNVLDCYMK